MDYLWWVLETKGRESKLKQMLLIVNPVAGTKKATKNLAEIIAVFNRAAYEVHCYISARRGDAAEAVKLFGEAMDIIVCCGGDGTLNETISGLLQAGWNIPIGYIPAGSTNDFASSLGLPADVIAAAKQIAGGEKHPYDIGSFNEHYFTYVASFGAFTKTSYATSQNIKNALGHTAYLLEGIQEISKIKKVHLRMDTGREVLEDEYLFGAVCNSTSVGGILTLKPGLVDLCDGQFEILLIRAPKNLQEMSECVVALKNQRYDCGMITLRNAGEIRITTDAGLVWSLDGERTEGGETVLVKNLYRRITLVH